MKLKKALKEYILEIGYQINSLVLKVESHLWAQIQEQKQMLQQQFWN